MEILIGIAVIIAAVIGFIYWYIESKINQVKDVAKTGAKVAKAAAKGVEHVGGHPLPLVSKLLDEMDLDD